MNNIETENNTETKPALSNTEHLLLMLTAATGILFFMINLRNGSVARFFDYFQPSSINYWLKLIYNLSLLTAPVMLVVGAAKMSTHPEKGWNVFFAGTAFHAFLLFLYFGRVVAFFGNRSLQPEWYTVLQLISSFLCIGSTVWLLVNRVRFIGHTRRVTVTIALTCAWLLFILINFLVNTVF
jgi:hypothetical protein